MAIIWYNSEIVLLRQKTANTERIHSQRQAFDEESLTEPPDYYSPKCAARLTNYYFNKSSIAAKETFTKVTKFVACLTSTLRLDPLPVRI